MAKFSAEQKPIKLFGGLFPFGKLESPASIFLAFLHAANVAHLLFNINFVTFHLPLGCLSPEMSECPIHANKKPFACSRSNKRSKSVSCLLITAQRFLATTPL